MTITEYGNEIVAELNNRGMTAEVFKRKKNQKEVTSITVNPKANMAVPTIYIDEMYSLGTTVAQAVEEILRILKQFPAKNVNDILPNITDYSVVKPLLKARFYWNNVDADVKVSAKKYGFDDLIIVPYIVFDMVENQGAIRVHKSLLQTWGITQKQVIADALDNVRNDYEIKDMSDMFGLPPTIPMYVVTNHSKMFGAISVLSAREKLNRIFPEGYYVLPSSVHEVIILSKLFNGADEMLNMVKDVNATVLDAADKLSDAVYIFG